MKRQRWDDRLATRAVALTRIAASERPSALEIVPTETTTAIYLALCGAHVVITLTDAGYRAACEACGDISFNWDRTPGEPERIAQRHAETCRRLPKRLWPKDGA